VIKIEKKHFPPVFHWVQLAPALYRDRSPCSKERSGVIGSCNLPKGRELKEERI